MRVGFIGLGSMGLPMADNLRRAGHELRVFNRTGARARALSGVHVATSPRDAAEGVDVLVTMLADDAAVEQMVLDRDGAIEGLAPGAVHAGMSTVGHTMAGRLGEEHLKRGQQYVSAPVFGRPDAARAAKLWIVAAGPAAAIDRCRPLLDAMGQGIDVVGDHPTQAVIVKLAGNLLLASAIEALGEAFALIRKHGIEPARFLEIVNGRVLRSPVYENYGRLIAEARFEPPGFHLRHGLKDVRLGLAAGEDAAVPLPVASVLRDRFLAALAWGWGDLDWAALARVAAVAAGLEREPLAATATAR
jgi:3-hydroxyisobutyrate dehydrogenase-like beta-hydroxyacid dehydrogenase